MCGFRRRSITPISRPTAVDLAVRHMRAKPEPDPLLEFEKLADIALIAVCSPRLIEKYGAVKSAEGSGALAADP